MDNTNIEALHFFGLIIPNNIDKIAFMKKIISYYKKKNIDLIERYKKKLGQPIKDKNVIYEEMFWNDPIGDYQYIDNDECEIPFTLQSSMGNILNCEDASVIMLYEMHNTNCVSIFSVDELNHQEMLLTNKINKFDPKLLDFLSDITDNGLFGWHLSYNIYEQS